MDEFTCIARYFAPLTEGRGEARGLTDDAALLPGSLVVTTDTLVEGVHYIGNEPPALIARKLLAVSLSDLAAKGASPYCYFLNLSLPRYTGENWIACFASGLRQAQEEYGLFLAGGDTTSTTGPAVMSVTALGLNDRPLSRCGASHGDALYVSGTIGDAVLGLEAARGELTGVSAEDHRYLLDRFRLPQPRLALGIALQELATAMIDVSDGLAQDAGHIARASGVRLEIEAEHIPFSVAARNWLDQGGDMMALLAGGDDYELLFTVPPSRCGLVESLAGHRISYIGKVREGEGVAITDSGKLLILKEKGWRHRI